MLIWPLTFKSRIMPNPNRPADVRLVQSWLGSRPMSLIRPNLTRNCRPALRGWASRRYTTSSTSTCDSSMVELVGNWVVLLSILIHTVNQKHANKIICQPTPIELKLMFSFYQQKVIVLHREKAKYTKNLECDWSKRNMRNFIQSCESLKNLPFFSLISSKYNKVG